uniref:Amyloid beta protein binding family B member 2 n=1 Tax=Nothobranchius furzeri TaxID=105023 RepID=A0A8C6K5N1_NOTFU
MVSYIFSISRGCPLTITPDFCFNCKLPVMTLIINACMCVCVCGGGFKPFHLHYISGLLSCVAMMSVDVANCNGPAATPPTSLNLHSSHNQLLGSEVVKQGSATPPKCRKKYALTSIQAAMGLGETLPPSSLPLSPSQSSSTPNNPKLAKNGVNQLRKAGQDHNQNTTGPDAVDLESNSETIVNDLNVNTVEEDDSHSLTNNDREEDVCKMDVKLHLNVTSNAESEQVTGPEEDMNSSVELGLNSNMADQDFDLNIEAEETDDISILSEKEINPMMKAEEEELVEELEEEEEEEEKKPLLMLQSECPLKEHKVSPVLELISDLDSNLQLLQSGKNSVVPPPVSPPRRSSEDTPLFSVSCPSSSSSSPETKKDRRAGAKTDCALNRIQNLNPSDEELSWTTLSQESNSPEETDIWSEQSFQTDPDLPPGWKKITDMAGVYYWHIPTGTTQWERPSSRPPPPGQTEAPALSDPAASTPRKQSLGSLSPLPTPDHESCQGEIFFRASTRSGSTTSDSSVEPFSSQEPPLATCGFVNSCYFPRSTSLQGMPDQESDSKQDEDEDKCFAVRSLGWVEMAEEDLAPGKSSVAVNNCIRQLSYCKNDIRDTVGIWGEGKDMYLVLENNMLNLVDPMDRSVLHSQPIASIRVWGVGRDNGRDFAYVARDKNTRILKCHVFRCDTPAKAIATSLHEICSRIMTERKNAKAMAGSSLQDRIQAGLDLPLQEFPTPKTELVQKFQVHYLGMMPVVRPIGMEILNEAIDSLIGSSNKEDWTPVALNVADATVTISKDKDEGEVLVECRVRFLSFMGVGRDVHTFAFIMDAGGHRFDCHVLWCEPNAGSVSEAVQAACMVSHKHYS